MFNLCPGGLAKLKDFVHKVDDTLQKSIAEITVITGKIKAIEADPSVQQIVDIIPNGSSYEAVFNAAVDRLAAGATAGLSVAEKIVSWLEGKTEDARDADLLKLASVATAIYDDRYSQHTYDTAVQVHIEGLK